jgi:hypothetical protein
MIMLIRIILGLITIILASGFLWFAAQVIHLGLKEFFKPKKKETKEISY